MTAPCGKGARNMPAMAAQQPPKKAADAPKAFDALVHNDGSLEKVLLRFADPE